LLGWTTLVADQVPLMKRNDRPPQSVRRALAERTGGLTPQDVERIERVREWAQGRKQTLAHEWYTAADDEARFAGVLAGPVKRSR
jgi:hypothetical protein